MRYHQVLVLDGSAVDLALAEDAVPKLRRISSLLIVDHLFELSHLSTLLLHLDLVQRWVLQRLKIIR